MVPVRYEELAVPACHPSAESHPGAEDQLAVVGIYYGRHDIPTV